MCADFRGSTLIKIAEMQRLELVGQAEQFRLAELAARGNQRRVDLRTTIARLRDRMPTLLQPRTLTRPIEFEPASESA